MRFFFFWIVLAAASLAMGVWRSFVTGDEGKGFTDAAYVVAVGGLVPNNQVRVAIIAKSRKFRLLLTFEMFMLRKYRVGIFRWLASCVPHPSNPQTADIYAAASSCV